MEKDNKLKIAAIIVAFMAVAAVIVYTSTTAKDEGTPQPIILATTTSTYDSGLLDDILPDFTAKTGIEVQILSVGTGQAITTAEQGNADVILIHAPASEINFVEEGHGMERHCVMYNDFVIVGPEEDPAGIAGEPIEEALSSIATTQNEFISRGDDSGTHKKELSLWVDAEIEPAGDWYLEIGQGMGDTLRMASEKQAYTMTDRGTWLALKDDLELQTLVEGDSILLNPYGVIAVNPDKNDHINDAGAEEFIDWLMSDETQDRIGAFTKNGEVLFQPLRGECLA